MIYFIRDPKTELVKIGYSKNVLTRLKSLQSRFGKDIYIAFLKDGGREIESQLHKDFDRFRHEGEWFRWDVSMEKLSEVGLVPTRSKFSQISKGISLDEDIWKTIEVMGLLQNRSLSNMVETLLKSAIEQAEKK